MGLIWPIGQIQIQLIEKNLHLFYKSDSSSNGRETLVSFMAFTIQTGKLLQYNLKFQENRKIILYLTDICQAPTTVPGTVWTLKIQFQMNSRFL